MLFAWAFFISFITALLLTPAVRIAALRFGAIDSPGPRKIHQKPTPLLGGVAKYPPGRFLAGVFFYFGVFDPRAGTGHRDWAFFFLGGFSGARGVIRPPGTPPTREVLAHPTKQRC